MKASTSFSASSIRVPSLGNLSPIRARPSVRTVLRLQQTLGNREVARLLAPPLPPAQAAELLPVPVMPAPPLRQRLTAAWGRLSRRPDEKKVALAGALLLLGIDVGSTTVKTMASMQKNGYPNSDVIRVKRAKNPCCRSISRATAYPCAAIASNCSVVSRARLVGKDRATFQCESFPPGTLVAI